MADRLSAVALVFVLGSIASAQSALDHVGRAARAYKHVTSLQVESEVDRDGGSAPTLTVLLYTTLPDRARIDVKIDSQLVVSVVSNRGMVAEYQGTSGNYSRGVGRFAVSFEPERGSGLGEMTYETIGEDVKTATVRGEQTLTLGHDRMHCVIVDVEYRNAPLDRYSFWIADNGFVLRRAVTSGSSGTIHTPVSTVKALTANEDVPETAFEIPKVEETPPHPAILL